MCFHLWIVSPLSLTEIRSMLPAGFSADIASVAEQATLRPRLPAAQTVAVVRIGACACPLRLARGGDDERYLRRRYQTLGLSRERVIAALDRHRRHRPPPGDPASWRAALAAFVVEHARNAGPTLYYLGFVTDPGAAPSAPGGREAVSATAVRAGADTWMEEGKLIEVGR